MIHAVLALAIVFGFRRIRFCLKFFQQVNYFGDRFLRFALHGGQLIDKRVFIPSAAAAAMFHAWGWPWAPAIACAALALQIAREKNPAKNAIKPLNMTGRAKRIFYTALTLWCAAVAASLLAGRYYLYCIAGLALMAPAFLIIAKFAVSPVDRLINQRYINEAKARLEKFAPTVIGITGSFGKTSVKNILHHILSSYSTSFTTKRSINVLMGIVRAIREEYNAPTKFFVAEMGIGDVGQMPQLARFLNPSFGIITAIGAAHLESFKSADRIAREKFRLSAHVARNGGRTLLNGKNIAPEFIKKYASPNDIVFTGKEISNVAQTADGLSFTLDYEGNHDIFAPIYGIHQAENIAVAFITAHSLGISAEAIITALKTLKQTEHRLEVRREGGLTVMDDAFNSNINGFVSALETGAAIKGAERFILITPGMVEVGALHGEQHKRAGACANRVCDIVIAVKSDRIKDFTDEIARDKLVRSTSLASAREWLAANGRPGDVVLYENDLPDVYIETIKI
ncbi:MAG: UDP-N-acetylmuramoyl-tripeptide--D-alanyl-D-alanine ligase [Rickettsiales bacterium]|jgi:UDP-N-acetylmuramoyl-tripeptide--D-alanyl-D-alanine ligase|nr:UDP-N-acetylmuramoyl-tripeptide--D-alanyl-D-alanine ligase [Rickettsiales bacterium]